MTTDILQVDLRNKAVLVTAGAAGIGRVIARSFASQGARVAVCDISGEALAEIASDTPGIVALPCDVGDRTQVDRLFDDVLGRLGGLDVLVNNAGIAGPTARVEDIDADALERTLAVDVASLFHCSARAVPALREAGGGAIVNLGSVASRLAFPLRTPYSAAKWGVVGFTKSLATELGPDNIRVNCVMPGHVESDRFNRVVKARAQTENLSEGEMRARYLDVVDLRRTVDAQDIANMVMFLASAFGANVTGQAISVCGGVSMLR